MEEAGAKRAALRIGLGAVVVSAGLAAVILAIDVVLDHYPPLPPNGTAPGDDRAAAAVAILTPTVAVIVGIVGLYFGVSATGSARGREAEARVHEAKVNEAKVAGAILTAGGRHQPGGRRRRDVDRPKARTRCAAPHPGHYQRYPA
jgi:uncharacterized membrane protein